MPASAPASAARPTSRASTAIASGWAAATSSSIGSTTTAGPRASAAGRAYVTDGKSHLIDFRVDGVDVGTRDSEVRLARPATVKVTAQVAARLGEHAERRDRGRCRSSKAPYWDLDRARRVGDTREVPVEVIVNGRVVATRRIAADGIDPRPGRSTSAIERSSWVALRILPSSHTNPMFVLVDGQPIRASKASAEWCLRAVDQCWKQKAPKIAEREQAAAEPPTSTPGRSTARSWPRRRRRDAPVGATDGYGRARTSSKNVERARIPRLPQPEHRLLAHGWIAVGARHVDQLRHAFVLRQLTEGEHRAFLDLGFGIVARWRR